MKWIEKLLQEVRAYRESKKRLYPDPRDKYYPKIKVKRSYGEDLSIVEEKLGIW